MNARWFTGLVVVMVALAPGGPAGAEDVVRIGIGHQSLCTDTYSGGITIKELGLLQKHLPKDGKYKGVKYDIVWEDYTSGPPITNQMLAGKLDIGVMGDYPLLVNIARFQEMQSIRSVIVSMTGYNLHGSGNSIVVPADAAIYRFEDLKGKRISVPFGSAAHGMVLKALGDRGLSMDFFNLINQSPPEGATTRQEQWTSIPKEVLYLYFGRGGFLTLDATIKPKWVEVLKYDATVLQKMGIIKQVDVEGVVDDRFLRQAYRELRRDYAKEQRMTVAGTSPMEGKDAATGAPIKDPRAAGELWLKGEPIKPYASLASLMAALREAEQMGRAVNAAYVFDQPTGLKLFAHRAFYVAGGSGRVASASLVGFAWKEEAETFATRNGGEVLSLEEAKKLGVAK